MNSLEHGNGTSPVEVREISPRGLWLLCRDEEFFLSYEDFPWFRDQPESTIRNVQEPSPEHLYWPDIDVDVCIDSIRDPGKFPLKARL